MTISIIGSGNTATIIANLLYQNKHNIREIYGRNNTTAMHLALNVKAAPCFNIRFLNKESDLYIIAVKDDAIAEVAEQLNTGNKILVHCCGSVDINVLSAASSNFGVLYPLQSLRKELSYTPSIPFLIDGNNASVKDALFNLANSISTNVIYANDDIRLKFHLSATIVSNFSNHLYSLTKNYCDKNGLDFSLLLPLIQETANRLSMYNPADMQTGPAIRKDGSTIKKHLSLLEDCPQLKDVYTILSNSIMKFSEELQ
ncbi:MAG: DUF2520 domain-containing protein [Bacteroidetes bacterium]|nr:DUF2520 domain-containing protein [Bacteroidota bacterium]